VQREPVNQDLKELVDLFVLEAAKYLTCHRHVDYAGYVDKVFDNIYSYRKDSLAAAMNHAGDLIKDADAGPRQLQFKPYRISQLAFKIYKSLDFEEATEGLPEGIEVSFMKDFLVKHKDETLEKYVPLIRREEQNFNQW
jgi:hypothetical protein